MTFGRSLMKTGCYSRTRNVSTRAQIVQRSGCFLFDSLEYASRRGRLASCVSLSVRYDVFESLSLHTLAQLELAALLLRASKVLSNRI